MTQDFPPPGPAPAGQPLHGESKKEWRRWALAVRRGIAGREEKAARIRRHLSELPALRGRSPVMVYAAIGEEVDLWPYAAQILKGGGEVAFPVALTRSKAIEPRLVGSRSDLAPGALGIPEPVAGRPVVPPECLRAVIVPGLAFDRDGYRVGYGGGYYDRFLPRLGPDAVKVGVVYGELLCDRLPRDEHDVPVDWVVTEAGALHCAGRERRA